MKFSNREFFSKIDTAGNLPTLPHILLRLIEACNREPIEIREISRIINKDPSLTARLMRLTSSVYYDLPNRMVSIDQAVLHLGPDSIKNMITCSAICQTFNHAKDSFVFRLKLFWWHSLMCAILAELIAAKTSYAAREEAFLSGLLHDIGKLVLWINFPEQYAEVLQSQGSNSDLLLAGETRLGATHSEIGAWIINRWSRQSFMADAVFYHHEPINRVLDALPLVKIVFVANALCSETIEDPGAKFKIAEEVFRFTQPEVEALIGVAGEKAKEVAQSLDIEIEPLDAFRKPVLEKDVEKQKTLSWMVNTKDISLLQGILQSLLEAQDVDSMLRILRQGVQILFDIHNLIFLLYDKERDVLVGKKGDPGTRRDIRDILTEGLVIPVQQKRCLLTRSLSQGVPLDSFGYLARVDLSIIDNQIIHLVGKDGVLYLPMAAHGQLVGVIVLGIDEPQISGISKKLNLLTRFAHQAALTLKAENVRQSQVKLAQSEQLTASSAIAKKVAHEVSNSLGIMKNYLKILGLKLAQDNPAQEELRIINEEIDRVTLIIRELSELLKPKIQQKELVDINGLISDLIRITHESLLLQSGVKAHLNLDSSLPSVMTDKNGLKQVFINLIKNAVEAMPDGGNLRIDTRYVAGNPGNELNLGIRGDQEHVEIAIRDDGPGIPDDVKSRLFEPFVSSKGKGHTGLGLSIAYNIIKGLNGMMTCESDKTSGTSFKIFLPIRTKIG